MRASARDVSLFRYRRGTPLATVTRNPWVALDVAADPVASARELRRVHERALGEPRAHPAALRELVQDSWTRSLAAGVQPDQTAAPVRMSSEELGRARASSRLAPAVEVIHAALAAVHEDARQIVAISDAEANLLWVTGDPDTCDRAREMRFEEGAAWSEAAAGTNAVGTAAALDHAVQIFSAEHMMAAVHPWTCAAAPIHDPATGELLGVIDLTADLRTNHPQSLILAAMAARTAEAALEVRALQVRERLRARWEEMILARRTPSALFDPCGHAIAWRGMARPPAAPDPDAGEVQTLPEGGTILWLNAPTRQRRPRLRLRLLGHDAGVQLPSGRVERGLRSLELLALLAMHPEGMSTEQLALALYGERGKAVTVRAQIHRVRSGLGGELVSAQPYRLQATIDADWLEVGRLIAAGEPRAALKAYRGGLLPASDAPAIAEARSLLEESLRRSVLTSADPQLLAAWLEHPAGADDLSAARALVAVLPAGDPRRAAATARAAAIARRMAPVTAT